MGAPRFAALRRSRAVSMVLCLAVLAAGGTGAGLTLARQYGSYRAMYGRDLATAHVAVQQVRDAATQLRGLAQHPFDGARIAAARRDFATASGDFGRIQRDLQGLPGAALPSRISGR
jgi:hypothetical protein